MSKLSAYAAKHGVKYFMVSFTDLRGVQRAKLVPAASIDRIASEGAGFAGFATWLDMTPADPDMLAMADARSVVQLPWKPEVAWVAGDLVMDGKPVEQAPRRVLQRQIQRAAELGYRVCTGVECEFFVLSPDGSAIGDGADHRGLGLRVDRARAAAVAGRRRRPGQRDGRAEARRARADRSRQGQHYGVGSGRSASGRRSGRDRARLFRRVGIFLSRSLQLASGRRASSVAGHYESARPRSFSSCCSHAASAAPSAPFNRALALARLTSCTPGRI